MIQNYKEYEITKIQAEEFRKAIAEYDFSYQLVKGNSNSMVLAQAEFRGLISEYEVLQKQLKEFENRHEITSVKIVKLTVGNDLFLLKWQNKLGEFGEITCYKEIGQVVFDSEFMGREFILHVFSKLLEEAKIETDSKLII